MMEDTFESVSETEKLSQVEEHQSEIEDLIAELCLNTSSNAVKFCLRKYQYGKSVTQIEKDIYKEKIELLKETAEFLKIQHLRIKQRRRYLTLLPLKFKIFFQTIIQFAKEGIVSVFMTVLFLNVPFVVKGCTNLAG